MSEGMKNERNNELAFDPETCNITPYAAARNNPISKMDLKK